MTQVVSLQNVGVLPFESFLVVDSRMPGMSLSDAVLEIPLCVYSFHLTIAWEAGILNMSI